MLNWKCIVPKGKNGILIRVKSTAYDNILMLTFAFLFGSTLIFLDNNLEFGAVFSTACLIVLGIKSMRIPYQDQGALTKRDYADKINNPEKCEGNPILESDEQIQARGTREGHACLMVMTGWAISNGIFYGGYYTVYFVVWLFVKYLASPILGWQSHM